MSRLIQTTLPIDTPEGISFSYELSSLTERGTAYGIDLMIRLALLFLVGLLLMLLLGEQATAGVGLWLILAFLVEWGYFVFFEMIWDGQSPGKRVLNLRVVTSVGHPIGFYDSLLRNLLRAADILPFTYAVGAISALTTYRFQRLGDLAADTIVIREQKTINGPASHQATPSLGQVQADLRGLALSNRERHLLEEFVLRSQRLHPERCEELAQILAHAYRQRYNLSQETDATALLVKLSSAGMRPEQQA